MSPCGFVYIWPSIIVYIVSFDFVSRGIINTEEIPGIVYRTGNLSNPLISN